MTPRHAQHCGFGRDPVAVDLVLEAIDPEGEIGALGIEVQTCNISASTRRQACPAVALDPARQGIHGVLRRALEPAARRRGPGALVTPGPRPQHSRRQTEPRTARRLLDGLALRDLGGGRRARRRRRRGRGLGSIVRLLRSALGDLREVVLPAQDHGPLRPILGGRTDADPVLGGLRRRSGGRRRRSGPNLWPWSRLREHAPDLGRREQHHLALLVARFYGHSLLRGLHVPQHHEDGQVQDRGDEEPLSLVEALHARLLRKPACPWTDRLARRSAAEQ